MENTLDLTLHEFVYADYLPSQKTKDSEEAYIQREKDLNESILPYLGQIPVSHISEDDIKHWQNQLLSNDKTPTYIKNAQRRLKSIFTYAKRNRKLLKDPTTKVFKKPISKSAADKIAQRRLQIIDLLQKGNISQKKLEETLGINENTRKKDIAALRKQYGYNIKSHKGIYSLEQGENSQCPITRKDVELFDLLLLLEKTPKTLDEIGEQLYFSYGALRKRLDKLAEDSLIQVQRETRNYTYENTSGIYLFPLPEDKSILLSFLSYCNLKNYTSTNIYFNFADSLSAKPHGFLVPVTDKDAMQKHIVNHAKQQLTLENLPYYIEKLHQADYSNTALSFTYSKKEKKNFFYVGMLAYSKEKDTLYLLGYERPTKRTYSMLRADKIDWDTLKSANNDDFQKELKDRKERKKIEQDFIALKNEMFDVSVDTKEKVKIMFEYSADIAKEIAHLKSKRSAAIVKYITDKDKIYSQKTDIPTYETITRITYEDTIRGLGDFNSYLRKFGDKVTVLENDNLKASIRDSAEKVLKRYRESEVTIAYEER